MKEESTSLDIPFAIPAANKGHRERNQKDIIIKLMFLMFLRLLYRRLKAAVGVVAGRKDSIKW